MARFAKERDLAPVLEASQEWFSRCLVNDGSILSSGSLWVPQTVGEAKKAFVDRPDEGKDSFLTKLKRQMQGSSPAAQQLMAEMLWALLLFPTNIRPATKREHLDAIWTLSGEVLPANSPFLRDHVLSGIGSGGPAFNNHRWRELALLIVLVDDLKHRVPSERQRILSDYEAFVEWMDAIPQRHGRQFRHMLRYFAFPDRVERISSSRDRRAILEGFNVAYQTTWNDRQVDEALLTLRGTLEAQYPGEALDFYNTPLKARWTSAMDGGPLQQNHWIFQGNSQQFDVDAYLVAKKEICWTVRQFRKRIRSGDSVLIWRAGAEGGVVAVCSVTAPPSEAIMEDEPHLWKDGADRRSGELRCRLKVLDVFVDTPIQRDLIRTALPSLSIIRSPQGTNFAIAQSDYQAILALREQKKGSIDSHEAYGTDNAIADLFMSREQFQTILRSLCTKKNVILQGPPGVGKTFVARRVAWALIGSKDESRVQMVQFHQSYSYEDFIQGIRPNGDGGFGVKHGVFYEFAHRARMDLGRRYVFIIDEINRGNLSKILGELMMLIEGDKRGAGYAIPLTYSDNGERFSVPENLYLLGLMNTADRSLAMVDYALRRRFRFVELLPEFERGAFSDHLRAHQASDVLIAKIVDRMTDLNQKIASDHKNLGRGFAVGHSFFCLPEPEAIADEDWYRAVIEGDIAPLIEEYWFDQREKAKKWIDGLLVP